MLTGSPTATSLIMGFFSIWVLDTYQLRDLGKYPYCVSVCVCQCVQKLRNSAAWFAFISII